MKDIVRHGAIAALGIALATWACSQQAAPSLSVAPDQPHAMKTAEESSTNLTEKLLTAVESGDLHAVEQAVSLGADVNAVDEFGFSVLVNALAHYKIDLVEFLIQHGAVTGQQRDLEGPPLKLAGTHNPDRQELLDEALLVAVEDQDLAKVKDLLSEGANINAADDDGFTVLVTALASYELELVNYLVQQGATITKI
ncbi:MAG: hypothetical protein VX834_12415 [Myxococcota bacterium]|nr:hypothetical protein [Myxococcota bacterium]